VPKTWGGAIQAWRDDQLFFVVPTPQGAQARVVDLRLQFWLEAGRVAAAEIQGVDFFVRWAEAMDLHVLDPAADRARIAALVADVLGGAVEAALPASRCTAKPSGDREIFTRACDGWSIVARFADDTDDEGDSIEVRGPSRTRRSAPK
jgi:hypothetical protein